MTTRPRPGRVHKKDREEAARLAKELGVRVTVGKFTFDPPGAAANDATDDEGARIQRQLDSMGGGKGVKR